MSSVRLQKGARPKRGCPQQAPLRVEGPGLAVPRAARHSMSGLCARRAGLRRDDHFRPADRVGVDAELGRGLVDAPRAGARFAVALMWWSLRVEFTPGTMKRTLLVGVEVLKTS